MSKLYKSGAGKNRIENDAYFTPDDVVDKCLNFLNETIDVSLITEWIEPSAGAGAFSNKIPNCIAYDINPQSDGIIKQDFLKLQLPYKKGRMFIGNPPYGRTNNLSRQFYNHAVSMGDYVAFILPASQYNQNVSLYKFDLVGSLFLGNVNYSGKPINTCFNVYKRPNTGRCNSKPEFNCEYISVYELTKSSNDKLDCDFYVNGWGRNPGVITNTIQYTKTLGIKCNNPLDIEPLKKFISNINWKEKYHSTIGGSWTILRWMLYKELELFNFTAHTSTPKTLF